MEACRAAGIGGICGLFLGRFVFRDTSLIPFIAADPTFEFPGFCVLFYLILSKVVDVLGVKVAGTLPRQQSYRSGKSWEA